MVKLNSLKAQRFAAIITAAAHVVHHAAQQLVDHAEPAVILAATIAATRREQASHNGVYGLKQA